MTTTFIPSKAFLKLRYAFQLPPPISSVLPRHTKLLFAPLFHSNTSTLKYFKSPKGALSQPCVRLVLIVANSRVVSYYSVCTQTYTCLTNDDCFVFIASTLFANLIHAGVPLVFVTSAWPNPKNFFQPTVNTAGLQSRNVMVLGSIAYKENETMDSVAPLLFTRLAQEEDAMQERVRRSVHRRHQRMWVQYLSKKMGAPNNTGRLDGGTPEAYRTVLQPLFELGKARYPCAVALAYRTGNVLLHALQSWPDVGDVAFHLAHGAAEEERSNFQTVPPAANPLAAEAHRLIHLHVLARETWLRSKRRAWVLLCTRPKSCQ